MFYTYLWLREDGTPYYIGKGKDNRAFTSEGHRVKRPPENRIIIQYYLTEADAFEAEKFLIAYYGRKDIDTGCLSNLTDGGEGASGRVVPNECRQRISLALSGSNSPLFGKKRDYCKRGLHEMSGSNVCIYGGDRICRECLNEARRERRKRNKVEKSYKTHCNLGHLLTENNLYRSGKRRRCKICANAASVKWTRKHREKEKRLGKD